MLLECSALSDFRAQVSTLISDCLDVLARLMWGKDQLLLSKHIIGCLDRMSCPPMVSLRPPVSPCPSNPPPCEALDAAISQQEVEFALPKLSNGKATGRAGWPAELLRYAAQCVTMDNGSRQKVWILAPLLTRLVDHCFRAGSLYLETT